MYALSLGVVYVQFDEWVGQPDGDEIDVDVTVGDIRVSAPRNWQVRVITDQGTATYLDGVRDDGVPNPDGMGKLLFAQPTTAKQGTLTVNASTRVGSVYIETGAPAAGTTPVITPKKEKKA